MTPVGIALAVVAVIAFFNRSTWYCFALFIAFAPFTATSVLNVGGADPIGFQPFFLFAPLFIARILISRTLGKKSWRFAQSPVYALVLFTIICAVSLSVPLLLAGDVVVYEPNLFTSGSHDHLLALTSRNVTQTLYVVFGVVIAVAISQVIASGNQVWRAVKVYLSSMIFVSLWGMLQFFGGIFHFSYPTLFNNSIVASARGYRETMNGISRISSVAVEPSILAQCLLIAIAFLLASTLNRCYFWSRAKDTCILTLMIIVSLLSTSFSAFMGLTVVCLIVIWRSRPMRRRFTLHGLLAGLVAVGIAVAVLIASDHVWLPYFIDAIVDKSGSGSVAERLYSVKLGLTYGMKFPILGLGWGSYTSHDFWIRTFANAGMLGVAALFGFVALSVRNVLKWPATAPQDRSMKDGALAAWVGLLVLCAFTSFPYTFGYFWFIVGLCLRRPQCARACVRLSRERGGKLGVSGSAQRA